MAGLVSLSSVSFNTSGQRGPARTRLVTEMILYTAIFGGYDVLRPTPYPSVCLTDGSVTPAQGWTVRVVLVPKGLDPQKASRYCKLFPWRFFPKAKRSVYFDGSIQLKADPSKAALVWLEKHDIAVFRHPERTDAYEEAVACIQYHKGNPEVIKAQMKFYRAEKFPEKFGLAACWVLVRRHSSVVKRFSELWWEQLCKFSKRDQLSFDYVRWRTGLQTHKIRGNLLTGKSAYFRRGKHK